MANSGHKSGFLSSESVIAFIRSLRPDADSMARDAHMKFGTVEKWYRKAAIEPSATNFLRVVRALGAERRLAHWLKTFAIDDRPDYIRIGDKYREETIRKIAEKYGRTVTVEVAEGSETPLHETPDKKKKAAGESRPSPRRRKP